MFGRKSRAVVPANEDDAFEVTQSGSAQRPSLSLKARAVALLSRREHSRIELSRKLAPHAESEEALIQVLDELAQAGWQSDDRFAQGYVHRKAPTQGTSRVVRELKHQGIEPDALAAVQAALKSTEFDRAFAVWSRKFKSPEEKLSAKEYARQGRFLASRGFSTDIIRRVLNFSEGDET